MSNAIDQITIGELQTAYPQLSAAQVADAPSIITAVSAMIARRYPLAIVATDFDELHTPGIDREITLRRRPVVQLYRFRWLMAPALTITRRTDARRANAQVTATGESGAQTPTALTLTARVNGANETPTVFDFATYPTLASLATAINLTTNWAASYATNQGDMDSTDLEPSQGPKPIVPHSTTGASLWGFTAEFEDWSLNQRRGIITTNRQLLQPYEFPGFTMGVEPRLASVRISYQAGHITPPADVKRAAIIAVGDILESTEKAGPVTSERDDDYSYTINPAHLFSPYVQSLLSPYIDRRPS